MKHQVQCKEMINQVSEVYEDHQGILPYVFAAFLVNGHVLIEGPPGTGKTALAKLISKILDLNYGRIQCTADLLPQDITGYSILRDSKLEFIMGPVFTDFLLVDELNRASPRAQSALLEAMEERQVTIDGKTHDLDDSFFVLATQNPQDHEGTFPLPEVQLDRFLVCVQAGHANATVEKKLLKKFIEGKLPMDLSQIKSIKLNRKEIFTEIKNINIDESLLSYIADLVYKARNHELIAYGPSLRAGLSLLRCSQALAYLQGRSMVIPDDIKQLAKPVLVHRIALSSQAIFQQLTKEKCIETLLMELPLPS